MSSTFYQHPHHLLHESYGVSLIAVAGKGSYAYSRMPYYFKSCWLTDFLQSAELRLCLQSQLSEDIEIALCKGTCGAGVIVKNSSPFATPLIEQCYPSPTKEEDGIDNPRAQYVVQVCHSIDMSKSAVLAFIYTEQTTQ